MPSISIDFSQDHADIIQKLAQRTGRTPKEFIEHIVGQHAKGQVDKFFQEKFNGLSIPQKKTMFGNIE